ncbi:MAG TPA: sigma factor-like helix-turn-helix DNA-binding protein [Jiangellales bacterium]|nr:sigma factor-like helix-turn-helix DNA-binding protein [Jiangellales bacterium]
MDVLDHGGPGPEAADAGLLRAVAHGDEAAFLALAERWTPLLRDLTACWSGRPAAEVEDAVRSTWLRVLREASAFRTPPGARAWLCRAALEESRSRGWLTGTAAEYRHADPAPSVEGDRFLADDHPQWPGHWARPPQPWARDVPDDETGEPDRGAALAALAELPEPYRLAVGLRDVAGCDTREVARVLAVSPERTRVLLQGGRAAVRRDLDRRLVGAGRV